MIREGLVRARRCESKTSSSSSPSPLAMHRDSHEISKFKPKIRIIHIFAPEIIKTDVENFRELVQRLTGKPSSQENKKRTSSRKMKPHDHQEARRAPMAMLELEVMKPQYGGYQTSWSSEESVIKHEEQMWGGENSSPSGFYSGFGDFEGFIQGLSEFPFSSSSSSQTQMDLFGETCLSQ